MADLYIVLDSVTDPFSAGLKKAAGDAESMSGRMGAALGAITKVGLGVGVAVLGIGAASVKAASDFQSNMTKLYTAAGAPKAAVQGATDAVLKLGTSVGMTGTQIAEALYHPVSAGLDMATSLQVVKYAAEEAQISGANLDDTTYSLSSVMKAFNFPASQAAQTMATLNAVVGDGDMRFQDFNQSIKNWAPTAAQMGISVSSMGAGLAYLTDRGNSAEEASTRLTMGLSMMATPSKQAAKLLEGLGVASSDVKGSTQAMTNVLQATGITQNQLAADLAKPDGLYVALHHLQTALDAAGVHGTEADSAIAKIFGGGRSDKAIMSLLQNLDGLQQKYQQITDDSTTSKFESNWESAKNTFSFQVQQIKTGAENLGIELGTKALPALSDFITQAEAKLGPFFQQAGLGMQQIASGFTGKQTTAPNSAQIPHMGNSRLNDIAAAGPQALTGWQKFGDALHRIVGDVETFGQRLEPIGKNFLTFGEDAYQALLKLGVAVEPTVKLLGGGLFGAVELVGKTLANVAGPAIKDFADFLASHQGLIKFFAEVILGGLILKMTILGSLNAAAGIIGIADAIVRFPLGQAGEITKAVTAVKTAFTGAEAAEGEQAVAGLAGSFGNLKTAVSGFLDKFSMFDGAKLSGLAKVADDMGAVENEAEKAGQLSLFETSMSGIVQAAEQGPEQLTLFETGVSGVEKEAGKAATSTGGLFATLSKFAVPVAILAGAAAIGVALGKLAGVGDHTGGNLEKLNQTLQNAAFGSDVARTQFEQAAEGMVTMSNVTHHTVQGLSDADTALATLVSSGHADLAKQMFNDISTQLQHSGVSAQDAAGKFPAFEDALKKTGDAAQTAEGQLTTMQNALNTQQATAQFQSDLNNLTTTIKSNGTSMSDNTDAAIANRQAFYQAAQDIGSYYQQQINAKVPIDQANKSLMEQVTQLEQTASNAGISKGEVDQYIRSLGLIPSGVQTTITMYADTSAALSNLQGVVNILDQIAGQSYAVTTGSGGHGGVKAFALGGWVDAPAGQPVPAIVHGGEFVISADMQAGRQPIDPRALGATALRGGGTRGGYTALTGSGSGAAVVNNYYQLIVGGSLVTESQALDKLRSAQMQWSAHNGGGTGWSTR